MLQIKITLIIYLLFTNCAPREKNYVIDKYDFNTSKNKLTLSKQLNEISGLASDSSGRVFCINDEKGVVFEISIRSGEIIKSFYLSSKTMRDDFEGIAIAGNTFYALTEKGDLYKFPEGNDEEIVEVEMIETPLKKSNDVEGLCFDSKRNQLLLACKRDPGIDVKDVRTVYSFDLNKMEFLKDPRFIISLDALKERFGLLNFSPSAIEYNQSDDSFYILSTEEKSLIKLSSEGKILAGAFLVGSKHRQPEGITLINGDLIISDEAAGAKPAITIY